MSTNFPSGIDTTGTSGTLNVQASATPLSTGHVSSHQNLSDSVIALETKVGVDSSAVTTTLDYKLKSTSSIDPGHKHTASVSLVTTGTPSAATVLYGDNSWGAPPTSADASTTVKGVTKMSVAPASSTSPISVGVNNTNSGTIISGTNNVEDVADTSATTSANKLVRANGSGKIDAGFLTNISTFNYQAFTANGTWTKPSGLTGNEMVLVRAWGAGGGGGGTSGDTKGGGGGGGGAFVEGIFRASDFGSTVTVTIGAGGSGGVGAGGSGSGGASTTFGTTLTAYGGGGGSRADASGTFRAGAGGGGGTFSAGTDSNDSVSGGDGGTPLVGTGGATGVAGLASTFGGGGGAGNGGFVGGSSIYGGAGGGSSANGGAGSAGGNSLYGGGGGGAGRSNSGSPGTGGTSMIGGAGGAGGVANTNGTAGSAPSGGGGGAGGAGSPRDGGAGARGEVRVWTLYNPQ